MARHAFFGRRRICSDVTSTATSKHIAITPHATALVRHDAANGTSTSATPKCTKLSATMAATCPTTKATVNPPVQRCSASSHGALGRGPSAREANARPSRIDATAKPQATRPVARDRYHHSFGSISAPPVTGSSTGRAARRR
jgi:hypothetical protein